MNWPAIVCLAVALTGWAAFFWERSQYLDLAKGVDEFLRRHRRKDHEH